MTATIILQRNVVLQQFINSNLVRKTILEKVFNGTSPWENFPPSHVSPFLTRKRVSGWGSRGAVFENLIRKVNPKTIIEFGTFLGASALHMVQLTQQLNLDTQIICIDDFRGWPGFRNQFKDIGMINGDVLLLHQFMQNVINTNASDSITFLPFSTGSGLENLCEWGVYGNLIEVDAGHDFHSAWSDINLAYKLLKPGGVMFGHDYYLAADNKGVRRAVNLFAKVNNLNVQVDGQHWVLV
ncbi:methyltransferase [Lithospermum erythrorhizon]|uniref:Methyltransferase n=1 Tax=Lithospermum erythrorhizon TaxID=34254 RepID=A0AAV3NLC1_LITER